MTATSPELAAGTADLGSPHVDMMLQWPLAHLRIDAGVSGGTLELAGDATIDEDRDGLVLSNFIVSYPGNQLHLVRDTDIHFRDRIVVEPLELVGEHGGLSFQAEVQPRDFRSAAIRGNSSTGMLPTPSQASQIGFRESRSRK